MTKQVALNILFGVVITIIGIVNLQDEETPVQVQPIDYKDYERRFNQLQTGIDSLRSQINTFEQETDSIKIKIINDESKVDHATNNDVDSMFNALFTRHK